MKTVRIRTGRFLLVLLTGLGLTLPIGVATGQSWHGKMGYVTSRSDDGEAWLGIWLGRVHSSLRKKYHLRTRDGVFVVDVVDDSPADKAGIRKHDVILKFDGEKLHGPADLTELLDEYEPGDTVKVEIERRGKRKTVQVVLASKPESPFRVPIPPVPGVVRFQDGASRLGVELQELNPDLARYFKLKKPQGALITSVEPDSPAEEAGLKAGDVIVEIDGEKVETPDDVDDILQDVEPDETVKVTVIREGRQKSFDVELSGGRWQGRFYVMPKGLSRSLRERLEQLQRYNLDLQRQWRENGTQERLERSLKELRKQMRELRRQFEEMRREFEKMKRSK
ncbi:MAG TPA: PDZ domain-containing protein [Bacteroidetes bacterium]|nr:PDZ domain-containing protein [Bacteroidota bacterium]